MMIRYLSKLTIFDICQQVILPECGVLISLLCAIYLLVKAKWCVPEDRFKELSVDE